MNPTDDKGFFWTYASSTALEGPDEATRLEIARILCPAGFVIVPTESMELPEADRRTRSHGQSTVRERAEATSPDATLNLPTLPARHANA